MKVTTEYIKAQFDKYNGLCFDYKLPPIEIKLSNARGFLGRVEYKKTVGLFGRVKKCEGFVMKISTSRDLSPDELDDVIIHEMIHYYIAYFGIQDRSAHGPVFRAMMADINARFGRNISISYKAATTEKTSPEKIALRIICISQMENGEAGVTVVSRTRVFDIMRSLPRYYRLKGPSRWYISTDPYFGRFPRSNTPKIYKAAANELQAALQNATELIYDGKCLKPVK